MKKQIHKRLTRGRLAELESLASLRDEAIDLSEAREIVDWSGAKLGLFYQGNDQYLIDSKE